MILFRVQLVLRVYDNYVRLPNLTVVFSVRRPRRLINGGGVAFLLLCHYEAIMSCTFVGQYQLEQSMISYVYTCD